jgi:hypothetical protein
MTPDRRLPPLNRRTDPPEKLARLAVALQPWRDLLTLAVLVGGILYAVLRFFGVGLAPGPAEEIAALRAEMAAQRGDIAEERRQRVLFDSLSARDRDEIRSRQRADSARAEEILFVLCRGLEQARGTYTCSRVLGSRAAASLSPTMPRPPFLLAGLSADCAMRPVPQMPPIPHRPMQHAAALLPAVRWPWRLALLPHDRPTDPYPEL